MLPGGIAEERLLTGAGRVRDLVDAHAGRADLVDRGVEVVDPQREVAGVGRPASATSMRCTCCPPASSQWPGTELGRSGRHGVNPSTSQ